jgi:hypothetical protein
MPRVSIKQVQFAGSADFAKKVHAAFMRRGLSKRAAAVATAHVALSTGWGRSVHNYSLAGIKAGQRQACYGQPSAATYSGPWFCSCSWEISKSGQPAAGCSDCTPKYGKPRCKYPFRAYRSLDEGVAAILGILKASRYRRALALLKAGDTDYFAEVGRAGWYTSNIARTAENMKKHYSQVLRYLGMSEPTSGAWIVLMGVAVVTGFLVQKYWK